MKILVTSSIIPYLKILYPHMGPPTTPGLQDPHHLNPALKRTFADLLPCYYYKIKTNSKTFHSQVWQLAPAGSIVASPKILGGNKIFGGRQNV